MKTRFLFTEIENFWQASLITIFGDSTVFVWGFIFGWYTTIAVSQIPADMNSFGRHITLPLGYTGQERYGRLLSDRDIQVARTSKSVNYTYIVEIHVGL